MEIKTCEQYVLARIKELEDENQRLTAEVNRLKEENDKLDEDYNVAVERVGKCLYVRKSSLGDDMIVDMTSVWQNDERGLYDWLVDTFHLEQRGN